MFFSFLVDSLNPLKTRVNIKAKRVFAVVNERSGLHITSVNDTNVVFNIIQLSFPIVVFYNLYHGINCRHKVFPLLAQKTEFFSV